MAANGVLVRTVVAAALTAGVAVTGAGPAAAAARPAPRQGVVPGRVTAAPGRVGSSSIPRLFTEVRVPRRLVITGSSDVDPVTVAVATPQTAFEVVLDRGDDALPGYAVFEAHPPVSRVQIGVPVTTALLHGWGHYTWTVSAYTGDHGGSATLPVEVRQGSQLHYGALRHGTHVRVDGSVSRYDAATDQEVAWSGYPATIQRWTSHGWRTIRRVRTHRDGGVDTTFTIGWKVRLRVTVSGTATTWAPPTYSVSA